MLVLKYVSLKKDIYNVQITWSAKKKQQSLEYKSREWRKWLSELRCLDFYANSPNKYHKKCMKNTEEKMHADIRA